MTQPTTARLDLSIWRNDDVYEYPLRVIGPNLTAVSLRAQIRLSGDAPGGALAYMENVSNGNAQGVRLASATLVDGRWVNDLRIRINKSTRQALPYAGELGDATLLKWAMAIGGVTRVVGDVAVLAHALDSDAALVNRPLGYPSAASGSLPQPGATLTITSDGGATIVIDGADLVGSLAADVGAALTGANGARDEALLAAASADLAATTAATFVDGVLYPTSGTGVAAVAEGSFFAVAGDDAATFATLYRKINGAAAEQARYVSRAGYQLAGGAAFIGLDRDWTVLDELKLTFRIERYLSKTTMAQVAAGERIDLTAEVQAAIDDVQARRGGFLRFSAGVFHGNWIIRPGVTILGAGRGETIFRAFGSGHVFRGPEGACVRFGWKDCAVEGSGAADQDCINLEPVRGQYDELIIENVVATGAGRHGLLCVGVNSNPRFVQNMKIRSSVFKDCGRESVVLRGTVIETSILDTFIVDPLDETGASAAMLLDYNPAEGGSNPAKVLMMNCASSNQRAHLANNGAGAKGVDGRDNACGIQINAGGIVTLIGHSFEFCSPVLRTADFSLAQGAQIFGGGVGIQRTIDDIFVLGQCETFTAIGMTVKANGQAFIRLTGGMGAARNVTEVGNSLLAGMSARVDQGNSYWQIIGDPASNDTIFSLFDYGRRTIVVRPHPNDGAGRVAYLRAPNGGLTRFGIDQEVTLQAFDGQVIQVLNGGNLKPRDGQDLTLSDRQSITYRWNPQAVQWWEIARSF